MILTPSGIFTAIKQVFNDPRKLCFLPSRIENDLSVGIRTAVSHTHNTHIKSYFIVLFHIVRFKIHAAVKTSLFGGKCTVTQSSCGV